MLHRQHDDPRAELDELGQDLEPRALAEAEVEDDDVGALGAARRERVVGGAGLADDLEVVDLVQQAPDAAADDRVVVHEHDADVVVTCCIP